MTTLKKLKYQTEVAEVIELLDKVSNAERKWKIGYDRSNQTLYSLLAVCIVIYHNIKGKPAEREALAAIKEALVKRGDTFNNKTKILTLIVRYVFKTQNNRAFIYSRVLGIAINDKVTPDTFADWVENFGGIEEVASKGLTPETLNKQIKLKEKKAEVYDLLNKKIAYPLGLIPMDEFIDIAGSGEYTLLIGKTLPDGGTQVLCSIPDSTDAMIDAAVTKIANALLYQPFKYKPIANQQPLMKRLTLDDIFSGRNPKITKTNTIVPTTNKAKPKTKLKVKTEAA